MNAQLITRVAADMRRELNGHHAATVERTVDHTLIRLTRDDSRLRLDVGRQYTFPDPDDAELVARAMDAPTDDPTRVQFAIPAQDGQKIAVKALRYTWSEA